MHQTIEISGMPGSGKSFYCARNNLLVFDREYLFTGLYKVKELRKLHFFVCETYLILLALCLLPVKTIWQLLVFSLNENLSFGFKLNIFRNTLRKFSINWHADNDPHFNGYIDEGISHIPFNFLSTSFSDLMQVISPFLTQVNVEYLETPDSDLYRYRLLARGHKRLKDSEIDIFIDQCRAVEQNILHDYPIICKSFRVIKHA